MWLIYFKRGAGDGDVALAHASCFKARAPPLEKFLQPGSVDIAAGVMKVSKDGKKKGWVTRTDAYRRKHQVSHGETNKFKNTLQQSPQSCKLNKRTIENMSLTLAVIFKKVPRDIKLPIVIQFDQDVPRQPYAINLLPCACPQGLYWLYYATEPHRQRLVTARELASLQGIGPEEIAVFKLTRVGDVLLKDLVGNAYAGPVCGACFLGSLLEWRG